MRLAALSLGPGPGAAEMILARCWNYYESCGAVKAIDAEKRSKLERIIEGMAARSLRCFAFACKQVIRKDNKISKENNTYKLEGNELTLLGFVGLKDPCRPMVRSVVKACKLAGVDVKMITGDNIFTAKVIAFECGILEPDDANIDGTVVEGQEFRNFSMQERLEKDIQEAHAGQIGAVFGVDCASGDTFTDGSVRYTMTSMNVPEPVMSLAVSPVSKYSGGQTIIS